jgi:hypothetical protein
VRCRSINGTTQRIATGTVIKPIGARASFLGGTESSRTRCWREPGSNPRSHPTALAAAHIRPMFVPTPRRSSAAALADGFVPLESDRRPLPDPATSFANSHYFRPVRPKRPASTSGTRSSNPFSSSGESANFRFLAGIIRLRRRASIALSLVIGKASRAALLAASLRPIRRPTPSCSHWRIRHRRICHWRIRSRWIRLRWIRRRGVARGRKVPVVLRL